MSLPKIAARGNTEPPPLKYCSGTTGTPSRATWFLSSSSNLWLKDNRISKQELNSANYEQYVHRFISKRYPPPPPPLSVCTIAYPDEIR